MALLHTTRRNIAYPNTDRSDRPDVPLHMSYLAAALDVDVVYTHGTRADRLAAAHYPNGGRFWLETDVAPKLVWYDDGTNWIPCSPDLPHLAAALSADVIVNNNNVFFDGPSVVLTPGTWFVNSNLTCRVNGTGTHATWKLWDGTTTYASTERTIIAGESNPFPISLSGLFVVPTGTATARISMAADANTASSNTIILKAVQANNPGDFASTIKAFRIGIV